MSITRFNEFHAKTGHSDDLHQLLGSIIPVIKAAKGCRGCQLMRNIDEPNKFIIIEEWQSRQAHQAAMQLIPPEKFQAAMEFFDSPPKGSYYQG